MEDPETISAALNEVSNEVVENDVNDEATNEVEQEQEQQTAQSEQDKAQSEDEQQGQEQAEPETAEKEAETEAETEAEEKAAETAEPATRKELSDAEIALRDLESQVPVSAVARQRAIKRDLAQELQQTKLEIARLRGRLEAETAKEQQQQATRSEPTPAQSPLDAFISEHGEDEIAPASVLKAESDFQRMQREQAEQKQRLQHATSVTEQSIQSARLTMSDSQLGEGLGLDAVVGLAKQFNLLTQADYQYAVSFGEKTAEKLYTMSIDRIKQAKGIPLQELSRRVQLRAASKGATNVIKPKQQQQKGKTGPSPPGAAETTTATDEEPSQFADILDFMSK